MTFGVDAGVPALNKVNTENAQAMVHKALDAGINFFDTANGYANGQSETILGKVLGVKRQEVVVATKVGFRTGPRITDAGLSLGHILSACEQSLQRLKTDYIDLYIVHKEDPFTPLEETLGALNDLVRQGKIRYLGFSNWSAWRAATALQIQKANGWARFTSGQMHYSLINRDVEHDVIPFMEHEGVSMTVWSPLAGGFLSGKYTRENIKSGDGRHAAFDIVPFDHEIGFTLIEKMRVIATRLGASVADVALAWLLAKPVVASIILGASNIRQLEANLNAVKVPLAADDIALLDAETAVKPLYPRAFNLRVADNVVEAALGSSANS
jgi:aryl-alcohol dehydrogenase-like predicted oxidoreductase